MAVWNHERKRSSIYVFLNNIKDHKLHFAENNFLNYKSFLIIFVKFLWNQVYIKPSAANVSLKWIINLQLSKSMFRMQIAK